MQYSLLLSGDREIEEEKVARMLGVRTKKVF